MATSDFTPKRRLISAVTLAEKAVVTTDEDHGYSTDDVVLIFVPPEYGMDIPFKQTKIRVTSSTQFETEINTSGQSPFVSPTFPPGFTPAQVIPQGTVSTSVSGATNNIAN